jgi:hypothetical protein
MRRAFIPVLAAFGLWASATTVDDGVQPAAAQAGCAAATFPDDRFIAQAFTDKFNGRYHNGERQLDVWRREQRLFVGEPGGKPRQLRRASDIPGAGEFLDGCGRAYQFVLPPDGPGDYVTIVEPSGARAEWHRR